MKIMRRSNGQKDTVDIEEQKPETNWENVSFSVSKFLHIYHIITNHNSAFHK